MRNAIAALLCLGHAAASSALAAEAPPKAAAATTTLEVGHATTEGRLASRGEIDQYRVKVERGNDYLVLLDDIGPAAYAIVDLRGPDGRLVARGYTGVGAQVGIDFQAETSGFYRIEVKSDPDGKVPTPYSVAVAPDCYYAKSTNCALAVGKPQQRRLYSTEFADLFRVSLRQDRTYTIKLDIPTRAQFRLLDGQGDRTVVEGVPDTSTAKPNDQRILKFRPPLTGTYFVAVSNIDEIDNVIYRVSLTTP